MTEEQQDDISSRTLFVLVILVLVVSFIGAWVSMTQVGQLSAPAKESHSSDGAQVAFAISNGPEPDTNSQPVSTGQVAFAIAK